MTPGIVMKITGQTADILATAGVLDTTGNFVKGLKADVYATAALQVLALLEANGLAVLSPNTHAALGSIPAILRMLGQ